MNLLAQITTAANSDDPALMKKVLCLAESVMMAEAMAGAWQQATREALKPLLDQVPAWRKWLAEYPSTDRELKCCSVKISVLDLFKIDDAVAPPLSTPRPYTLKEIRDGRAEG